MHIEFFSLVPGVAEAYPIYEAKDFQANWIATQRQNYLDTKKKDERIPNLYKCPGIFDLFNFGFIVPLYSDLSVTTTANGEHADVRVANEKLHDIFKEKMQAEMIQFHSYKTAAKYFPYRPGTLQAIFKINTPWHIVAPEGLKFIILPIAYPDEFLFEQTIGILDPSNSAEINAQLYWHSLGTQNILKAGTPLLHIIPLTEKKVTFECRTATEKDKEWREKFIYAGASGFQMKRGLIKKLYNQHFKKKSMCPFHGIFKK